MQVKLREIWESGASFERFMANDFSIEKLGWKLGRMYTAVKSELATLQKSHQRIVKRLGVEIKDEKGAIVGYRINPLTDAQDAYDAEWNDFLDTAPPIEIWGDPVKLADVIAALGPNAVAKPMDLAVLSWLIKE